MSKSGSPRRMRFCFPYIYIYSAIGLVEDETHEWLWERPSGKNLLKENSSKVLYMLFVARCISLLEYIYLIQTWFPAWFRGVVGYHISLTH